MTPEDIDWPPPICEACRWAFHDLCGGWCECAEIGCVERLIEETP